MGIFSLAALGAPEAELWERWNKHDGKGAQAVSHSAWDSFLASYVAADSDGINRVAYAKVSAADRTALDGYLKALQSVKPTRLSRAEQRAYWINLYNAQTVRVVLQHFPVDSIMKINTSPGLFSRGPWGEKSLKVEGEAVSLDDIEHRILRPIWKDPRTHYAVNCASNGCPNLATQAYTPERMEEMLDAGARAYVNHPRGVAVQDGRLKVSSIYVWFVSDFGGGDAGVIAHLKKYAEPPLARQLDGVTAIGGHAYDWALNNTPGTTNVSRR